MWKGIDLEREERPGGHQLPESGRSLMKSSKRLGNELLAINSLGSVPLIVLLITGPGLKTQERKRNSQTTENFL
jgi:hypothetical protein